MYQTLSTTPQLHRAQSNKQYSIHKHAPVPSQLTEAHVTILEWIAIDIILEDVTGRYATQQQEALALDHLDKAIDWMKEADYQTEIRNAVMRIRYVAGERRQQLV